jgi:hypothetical protein
MNHQAIYNSHPNAITIRGNVAYDSDDQVVAIDQSAYDAAVIQLDQDAEAKEQLRTSVINKIATNLTSEEKAWLEENL